MPFGGERAHQFAWHLNWIECVKCVNWRKHCMHDLLIQYTRRNKHTSATLYASNQSNASTQQLQLSTERLNKYNLIQIWKCTVHDEPSHKMIRKYPENCVWCVWCGMVMIAHDPPFIDTTHSLLLCVGLLFTASSQSLAQFLCLYLDMWIEQKPKVLLLFPFGFRNFFKHSALPRRIIGRGDLNLRYVFSIHLVFIGGEEGRLTSPLRWLLLG